MNILVTSCCGVVSRAIARSIRTSTHYANSRIIGVDVCDNWYPLHESLYDRFYRVSNIDNSSKYRSQIQNIIAQEDIHLAVVTSEKEVLFWSKNKFEIPTTLPPAKFSKLASNKQKLYEVLARTGLVPDFAIHNRSSLLGQDAEHIVDMNYPLWIRDFSVASDSGKGALKVHGIDEIRAWATLNQHIDQFMISAFLPGRNYAQCMLFHDDKLLKTCCYERLEYFMGDVAPSGITGNICRGRLINEPRVRVNAEAAVREVGRVTGEKMTGLLTVDLREDKNGVPLITEINIRHTAPTSAYAAGGCNMVEAQIHHTLRKFDLIDGSDVLFPEGNYILRDIDGPAIYIREINMPESGCEFLPADVTPG